MKVNIFDDWLSIPHFFYAFIIMFLKGWFFIFGTWFFIIYQLFTSKNREELMGDICEFTLGVFTVCFIQQLFTLCNSI